MTANPGLPATSWYLGNQGPESEEGRAVQPVMLQRGEADAVTASGLMGPFPGTSFQTRVGSEYSDSFILSHSHRLSF